MVDTKDLKSFDRKVMRVRVSPRVLGLVSNIKHDTKNKITARVILFLFYFYLLQNFWNAFKIFDEGFAQATIIECNGWMVQGIKILWSEARNVTVHNVSMHIGNFLAGQESFHGVATKSDN